MGYRLWIARKIMRLHHGNLTILREDDALAIILTFPLLHERNIRSSKSIPQSIRANLHKSFTQFMPPFTRIAPLVDDCAEADIEAQDRSTFKAPLAQVNADAMPGPLAQVNIDTVPGIDSSSIRTDLKFLVVDDSAMVRKMSMKLLRSLGYSCDEADDGDVAVSLVRSKRTYDIILMDNQMPRMTGEEATQIIRKELNFKGMIFGVTGNALAEDIQSFIDKGVNEVIIKPLTATILQTAIQNYLKKAVENRDEDPVEAMYRASFI